MADVFISYAREDRKLAEELANTLHGHGISVWWDAELVGSDQFQDVILEALAKAKAAIVIWSRASVKSLFVRDEARYALHYNKLVAVKTRDLEILDIPFGFQGQHTDDIANHDNILKAIEKFGIEFQSAKAKSASATEISWETIKQSKDPVEVLGWIEQNPTHIERDKALALVRTLVENKPEAARSKKNNDSVSGLVERSSNVLAFLRGFTFRVPNYQWAEQGKWSSIGFSTALFIVFFGGQWVFGYYVVTLIEKNVIDMNRTTRDLLIGIILFSFALASLLLIRNRFNKWADQRSFGAAYIMAFLFVCLSTWTAMIIGITYNIAMGSRKSVFAILIPACVGLLLGILYVWQKLKSVR